MQGRNGTAQATQEPCQRRGQKKDKNHDGSVSRDEHLEGESDKHAAGKKFDAANKNGDRSLTKSEIADLLGL